MCLKKEKSGTNVLTAGLKFSKRKKREVYSSSWFGTQKTLHLRQIYGMIKVSGAFISTIHDRDESARFLKSIDKGAYVYNARTTNDRKR